MIVARTLAMTVIQRPDSEIDTPVPLAPALPTPAERMAEGRKRRRHVPRSSHGGWKVPRDRRDPIDILEESNPRRLPELVPIRYGRMLESPYTFLRGAPAVMAADL